jgi:hypothetical protein
MNAIIRQLPPLVGVIKNQRATLDLPIGPRYHKLIFEGTVTPPAGVTAAYTDIFGMFRILIGGKVQREANADEINAINNDYGPEFNIETQNITSPGNPLANGHTARFRLTVFFSEPFRKSYLAEQSMAWPTSWPGNRTLDSFQVTIDVPNSANFTNHDIKCYSVTDNGLGFVDKDGNPIFLISKWWRSTIPYTAAGELFITDRPRRDVYQELNFFAQTADPISNVKIKVDGVEIRDVPKAINDADLVSQGMVAPSASRFKIVFDRDDKPDSAMPMNGVRDFQIIATLPTAAATSKIVTLVTQVYGPKD